MTKERKGIGEFLLKVAKSKVAPKVIQKLATIKSLRGKIEIDQFGFFSISKHPELVKFLDMNNDGRLNIKDLREATFKGIAKIALVLTLIVIATLLLSFGKAYIADLTGVELP